jgi:hypothetical protein
MFAVAPFLAGLTLATGTPEVDVVGPMTLCFRYSSFMLGDGESVEEVQMGIHGLEVAIASPPGRYEVHENEILASPRPLGRRVLRTETASVYRLLEPSVSYAILARPEFSRDRDVMLLVLTGDALEGNDADARIYARVTVGDPTSMHCDRRYLYGWDAVLAPGE